jgi:hypothetical protein
MSHHQIADKIIKSQVKEIKSTLNLGHPYYHVVKNHLFFCLLCKNIKIKICTTIILLPVLYGCETWSLAITEEHKIVSDNRILRRIFGPTRDEVTEG